MQIQRTPLTFDKPPDVMEWPETFAGFEASITQESGNAPGAIVILGENLDAEDQTQKIIHAVAVNGHLLESNLPPAQPVIDPPINP